MRWLSRFHQISRSVFLCLTSVCLGLMVLVLNPISPAQSISLQATLTPTPSTQGEFGREVFYLKCMPCHGDKGQGLTGEFRTRQYPPEDQNCWKSGCHGDKPYFNGFTLPKTVPALIGPGTLGHFATAQDMYNFVSKAMPFNKPGGLSQTEYLQAMAFILSSNQLIPADAQIDLTSLASIKISQSATATPTSDSPTATSTSAEMPPAFWGIIIFLIIATILSIITRRRK